MVPTEVTTTGPINGITEIGGVGDDTLNNTAGHDTLDGGAGNDTIAGAIDVSGLLVELGFTPNDGLNIMFVQPHPTDANSSQLMIFETLPGPGPLPNILTLATNSHRWGGAERT